MLEVWAYVLCSVAWAGIFTLVSVSVVYTERARVRVRLTILSLIMGWFPLVLLPMRGLLGQPTPVLERGVEVRVLASKYDVGEAIYLYLDQPGAPRSVALPWNEELAEQLEEGRRAAMEGAETHLVWKVDEDGTSSPGVEVREPESMPEKSRDR